MEEKAKVVEMPGMAPKKEKMSYEELEKVAHQLSEQNNILYSEIQRLNMQNTFKRLDYLLTVVDRDHKDVFDVDFVEKCSNEITMILDIPEEEEETDSTEAVEREVTTE